MIEGSRCSEVPTCSRLINHSCISSTIPNRIKNHFQYYVKNFVPWNNLEKMMCHLWNFSKQNKTKFKFRLGERRNLDSDWINKGTMNISQRSFYSTSVHQFHLLTSPHYPSPKSKENIFLEYRRFCYFPTLLSTQYHYGFGHQVSIFWKHDISMTSINKQKHLFLGESQVSLLGPCVP